MIAIATTPETRKVSASLLAFVDVYAETRHTAHATVKAMRKPVRSLGNMLGHPAMLPELTLDLIDRWAAWRREQGGTESTVSSQRAFLLSLWRLAADMGLPTTPPPRWLRRTQYATLGTTRDDLRLVLESGNVNCDDVRRFVGYFAAQGIKRPAMAAKMGIAYSYLNAVLHRSKPITTEFCGRLARVLEGVAPKPKTTGPKPRIDKPLVLLAKPCKPEPERKRPDIKPVPTFNGEIPEPAGVTLLEYLIDYLLQREVGNQHQQAIASTVRRFGEFLGRPATVGDFQPWLVNHWLATLSQTGLSPSSVRGLRSRIVALWNAAYREDPPLVDQPPLRVRPVKVPRRMPEAWTPEDMQALLTTAAGLEGKFTRARYPMPKAAFWRAFLFVAYDTGLRLGDIERLRFAEITAGTFAIDQHKTGKPIRCSLYPETMDAINAIASPAREFVFGGVIHRRTFFRAFQDLMDASGLKGSSRKIRRTSGTLVENISFGAGHKHLGNGADVFQRHYCDQRLLTQTGPMPPRLIAAERISGD